MGGTQGGAAREGFKFHIKRRKMIKRLLKSNVCSENCGQTSSSEAVMCGSVHGHSFSLFNLSLGHVVQDSYPRHASTLRMACFLRVLSLWNDKDAPRRCSLSKPRFKLGGSVSQGP